LTHDGNSTPARDLLAARLAALSGPQADAAEVASLLPALHRDVGLARDALNARLLDGTLEWREAERREAAAMRAMHHQVASIAYRLARSPAAPGAGAPRDRMHTAALALQAMGDALKADVMAGRVTPPDYAAMHWLMREAITRSWHRESLSLDVAQRAVPATIEALYFRALLLARFAGGKLNAHQVEILDAWIYMWLPVLKSTMQPPGGSALRADLDSDHGLLRGARGDAGPAIYLPQGPIEQAYREVVLALRSGRIVPAGTLASTFRIEEHVAVLDLLRRRLRESRAEPVARAARRPEREVVEVHVGLPEIVARGFSPMPPAPSAVALAASGGQLAAKRPKEYDNALGGIYEPARRHARLVDRSESGFGLEGDSADFGQVTVGDLVGLRLQGDGPLVLGRVARSVVDRPGSMRIGVQRLTSISRPADVESIDDAGLPHATLLFVPGGERDGTQDGFLVSEIAFGRGGRIAVAAGGNRYTLRFNRVRQRGRGWVLAGFAVTGVMPAAETLSLASTA
jgi:hypothetical protein